VVLICRRLAVGGQISTMSRRLASITEAHRSAGSPHSDAANHGHSESRAAVNSRAVDRRIPASRRAPGRRRGHAGTGRTSGPRTPGNPRDSTETRVDHPYQTQAGTRFSPRPDRGDGTRPVYEGRILGGDGEDSHVHTDLHWGAYLKRSEMP
jgi:hypothetical protein